MKKSTPLSANIVHNYLMLAHNDYLTARFLLRNGFLEHGAMLASTAAEKYLKAVIGTHGINNLDHLGGTLYKLVGRYQPELSNALDRDFLKFLEKAYKLRYASASSPGLAIVINQYRSLMAIDSLVAQIDAGFDLKIDGNPSKTPYQRGFDSGDVHLIEDNVVLTPSLSSGIVQRNNKVIELKVENNYDTLRVQYETVGVNVTGLFSKIPELSVSKQTFVLTRG